MKMQLCAFRRKKNSPIEKGVAFLKIFNLYDVDFIIDEQGKKMKSVFDYKLIDQSIYHPLSAIDTDTVDVSKWIHL